MAENCKGILAEHAQAERTVAKYGAWRSPVSAEKLAEGAISVSDLRAVDGRLYWLEDRPNDGGRRVAITGDAAGFQQITPDGFNVRTRVHEYGGASYAVIGDQFYFSHFADQKLYVQTSATAPTPLTRQGYRFADFVAAPSGGLIGVREDHTDTDDIKNAIVAVTGQPEDAGHVLFDDSDFVAYPRVSSDGRRLAWVAWDHPSMPWDDTRLYVADLGPNGLANVQVVAGGNGDESVLEPQWGEDGSLYFISDRSGFWNLYAYRGLETEIIWAKSVEFAEPLWLLGQSNYAVIDASRLVATYADGKGHRLAVINHALGSVNLIDLPFNVLGSIQRLNDSTVALTAASGLQSIAVVTVDIDTGAFTEVRRPSPAVIEDRYVSEAQAITCTHSREREIHALYYPPMNPDFIAPSDSKPPLIVQVHGGPTSQASRSLNLANQYWTSRGFAVLDVDHGGSSGYGRAYRQRLNGQWGIVDVEDIIAAVRHLLDLGWADPNCVAIHGGSAGGFTVLNALARSNIFKAGASFYGIANLEALAHDTHKFESRYLDNLVGPYPAAKAVYRDRSPINQLDGLCAPLIIFQGEDDPIVPPSQALEILDALRARNLAVAYMEFSGEAHGFRRAENIITSKQAELYFYGQIFGFAPADDLPEVPIENLRKSHIPTKRCMLELLPKPERPLFR